MGIRTSSRKATNLVVAALASVAALVSLAVLGSILWTADRARPAGTALRHPDDVDGPDR